MRGVQLVRPGHVPLPVTRNESAWPERPLARSVLPAARGAHEGQALMANWQTRQVLTIDVDSLGLKSVQATAVAERIGVPSGCQRVAYAQGKGLGLRSGALHDHPTGADALFTRHWSRCLD